MQCATAPLDLTQQSALGPPLERQREGETIYCYDRQPARAELLRHLRAQDKVVINLRGIKWQEIEREIECARVHAQWIFASPWITTLVETRHLNEAIQVAKIPSARLGKCRGQAGSG